jgi:hypothetical protein
MVCIEQVHGAAGCSPFGKEHFLWNPEKTGSAFELTGSSLAPLEPYRKYLTIVSNTDTKMAEAMAPAEVGGDHFRSSAVMYTHVHPKLTEGSDVHVGTSLDQLYVQRYGQDTPIRRCSSRSSRSISPAAARTATRASTPTRSAGPRPISRCRWCAIRAWSSSSVRRRRHQRTARRAAARPTAASSTC